MARDFLSIGPTPSSESCEQLGPDCDKAKMMFECRTFIEQLTRQFGEPPKGARLFVLSNNHDFGNYREVAVEFDEDYPAAVDYAYRLESHTPEFWDDVARDKVTSYKEMTK